MTTHTYVAAGAFTVCSSVGCFTALLVSLNTVNTAPGSNSPYREGKLCDGDRLFFYTAALQESGGGREGGGGRRG